MIEGQDQRRPKVLPVELGNITRYSIHSRKSLVNVEDFASTHKRGSSFIDWFYSLPNILAGREIKEVAHKVAQCFKEKKLVLLGMGAHPIKVGLGPVINQLIEAGVISAIAMNGACIVHDTELAIVGSTSEDVRESLATGEFGMAEETGRVINQWINQGAEEGLGLGEAVCRGIGCGNFEFGHLSILKKAWEFGVPVTVHVAIGTDIIHLHPEARGDAIGIASHLDFKRFCSIVCQLEGGVYINLGSAVIMPEVFLKAVTVARNLGHPLKEITTVTMDFIRHYRAQTNVVTRPTLMGGKGYYLVGHHELMLPLLAAAGLELIA